MYDGNAQSFIIDLIICRHRNIIQYRADISTVFDQT